MHPIQIKFLLITGAADGDFGLPQIASTGTWSSLASYRPVLMWVAPGPPVGRQTPISPAFGEGHRHHRRRFFMAHLEEFDRARALPRPEHAIDASHQIAVDSAYTPIMETPHEEIADFHLACFSIPAWSNNSVGRWNFAGPHLRRSCDFDRD
jgi:hypothetical protein